MTGCDIAVERKILGSLGPLTQFRYLLCHFSSDKKIATPLPITGYIRSLTAKIILIKNSHACADQLSITPHVAISA